MTSLASSLHPSLKVKMTLFLKSIGFRIAMVITNEFVELTVMRIHDLKPPPKIIRHAKAQYTLPQALNDDDLSRVINCKFAFQVWNELIITHEGISQVKRSKIDLFRSQYENFFMLDNESKDEMLTRFTKITNGLSSSDDEIGNDQ